MSTSASLPNRKPAGTSSSLVVRNLKKRYGSRTVVKDVSLDVKSGEVVGLLGPNGAGKTTSFYMIVGLVPLDAGEIDLDGKSISLLPIHKRASLGLSYLPQEASVFRKLSVEQNIRAVLELQHEDNGKRLTKDAITSRVEALLDELQISHLRDNPALSLSGGERRRVALCRLLLDAPDILLLDEPTNHLDAESVEWLEHTLVDYKGCVILVTHDRYFLDNVTKWILELDRGKGIPHEGNYSSFLEIQEKRLKQESNEEAAQQRTIAREREWIRQSPKARHAKSQARINRYEELVAKSQEQRAATAQIMIPVAEWLGDVVIEAENLAKGYGDRLLYENVNFKLPPGGIVGVIGANGAGKTTLFRMLTGQEKPDSGTLKVGPTVQIGYVDQSRDTLDPKKNVWEEISGGTDILEFGKTKVNSRAYVGAFAFKGGDQQKKVGQLSGGERNRVHLAKMLKSGANLLLLDEPTNDLDVDTLRALESALEEFAGCALIISHDRWFLDRIATHMLAFEGDSHVEWFEGNFQDYEADKKRRLGVDADQPHKLKYKRFART